MPILTAGFFFATAAWLGFTLLHCLKLKLATAVTLAASLIIGLLALTQIIFWQSWLITFSAPAILVTLAIIILACAWFWLRRLKSVDIKINRKALISWLIWLAGWLVLWLILWPKMLYRETDGLYAGWVNIWGDWAAHLTYTTSFAYGDNFPPQMPILIGAKFSYPFMADFLSAILIKIGAGLIPAMLIPSIVLSMALVILLTGFGQTLTKKFSAGKLTAILFLFNGGLGWWWWLKDIKELGLTPTLVNLPREYTHLEKLFNIEWINVITSQVIPQRGFLLGFPAAILVYLFFWHYWQKHQRRYLLAAGLVTALLPLAHAHSVAIIIAVAAVLFTADVYSQKNPLQALKDWLWFGVPFILIGLPVMIYFYWSSVGNGTFIKVLLGWLSIKRGDRIDWFWVKNLGLMSLLPLIGLKTAGEKLRWFSLPFWLIFIAANIWLFQPWEWDNTKFFIHWYLMACVLAAGALTRLPRTLTVVILFITVFAGLLDVWRLSQYDYRKIRFWDNQQLQFADWVKDNTDPGSSFLTADNHDHWLPTLTGRKTLTGFRGWLWTYGINYQAQEQATETIFQGKPEARAKIKAYGLDYAVIGPMEKERKPIINESWFQQNFKLVYSSGETKIYSFAD